LVYQGKDARRYSVPTINKIDVIQCIDLAKPESGTMGGEVVLWFIVRSFLEQVAPVQALVRDTVVFFLSPPRSINGYWQIVRET